MGDEVCGFVNFRCSGRHGEGKLIQVDVIKVFHGRLQKGVIVYTIFYLE